MATTYADLSSLNDSERTVLGLLAQGHTVKSIATLTQRSEASVNERLREARRKTGVGSSRELARLLREQENRDEEIGVADGVGLDASKAPEAAPLGRGTSKGIAAMALTFAAAAAILLLQPQTVPAPDPLLGNLIDPIENTMPALHQRTRAEPRDRAWAPQAETALHTRFAQIPGVAQDRLRVICGKTLCEVAGILTGKDEAALNAVSSAVQGRELRDDLDRQGFAGTSMGFGTTGLKTESRFVAYWTRK